MNKIIIANQKTYLDQRGVDNFLANYPLNTGVVFCPSNIFLKDYIEAGHLVGVQNISDNEEFSQTGETTAKQLKSLGVHYVIVGHSERRTKQKETEEIVKNKLNNAIDNYLTAVLCIGESLEEYDSKLTKDVLLKQLDSALEGITSSLIIAYEPIWAIGTGLTPNNEEIKETALLITKYCQEKDLKIKLLYGGSVNSSNIDKLNEIDEIDGYLIGGASTDFEELIKIVNSCA